MEDSRQPAAQPGGAVARPDAGRGLDVPARVAGALDDAGAAGDRVPRLHAGRPLADQPPLRRSAPRALPGRARQHPGRPQASRAVAGDARASDRGDARCHRTRAVPHARHPAPPAAVADRGSRCGPHHAQRRGPADVDGAGDRAGVRGAGGHRRAGTAVPGGADPVALGAVARARPYHRSATRASPSAAQPRSEGGAAAGRAQDLALLRGAADSGRQLADPGQLSGEPRRRHRAPDLADQHRPPAPDRAGGARLRLSQHHRRRRSAGADLRHAAADATLSRALLQLVRHAHAGPARAAVYLDRRQRQPGRLPPDASLGTRGAHRVEAADRHLGARGAGRRAGPVRDGSDRRRARGARTGRQADRRAADDDRRPAAAPERLAGAAQRGARAPDLAGAAAARARRAERHRHQRDGAARIDVE